MEFINTGSGWMTWFFSQTAGSILAFKLSKPADPAVFEKLHDFFGQLLKNEPASIEIRQEGVRDAQIVIEVQPSKFDNNIFGYDALLRVTQHLPHDAILTLHNLPINTAQFVLEYTDALGELIESKRYEGWGIDHLYTDDFTKLSIAANEASKAAP